MCESPLWNVFFFCLIPWHILLLELSGHRLQTATHVLRGSRWMSRSQTLTPRNKTPKQPLNKHRSFLWYLFRRNIHLYNLSSMQQCAFDDENCVININKCVFSPTLYTEWPLFKLHFLKNWGFINVTLKIVMSEPSSAPLEMHFTVVQCFSKWKSWGLSEQFILLPCCWHGHPSISNTAVLHVYLAGPCTGGASVCESNGQGLTCVLLRRTPSAAVCFVCSTSFVLQLLVPGRTFLSFSSL